MAKRTPRKQVDVESARIGFVGSGKIAAALINGFIVYGKIEPKRIFVAAPTLINTDPLKLSYKGIRTSKRNIDIFGRFDCDLIFICCPPHVVRNLYKLGGTRPVALTTNYIPNMKHPVYVLSLVFGFTVAQIKECLLNPENPHRYQVKVYRSVISSAAAYGIGNCYIDIEPDSANMSELLRNLIGLVARLEFLPENLMDAVCTIAGPGLSFCYYFINSMSDGALKIGLSRAASIKFTSKVAAVAGQCVLETGKPLPVLKDEACTPSGASVYGIAVLEKGELNSGVVGAIEAAHKRAQELAVQGIATP